MIIPNAENIEGAADALPNIGDFATVDQVKELRSAIGAATAEKLAVAFPLSKEFETGYALGLQTARAFLAGSAELILHGVDPAKVL